MAPTENVAWWASRVYTTVGDDAPVDHLARPRLLFQVAPHGEASNISIKWSRIVASSV